MGLLQRKQAIAAGTWARVDNANTEQTIKATEGILWKITVTGDGAAGTLTISNGAAATAANILTIVEVAAGESKTFDFGVLMTNGIRVTPGEITTDSVVIYD